MDILPTGIAAGEALPIRPKGTIKKKTRLIDNEVIRYILVTIIVPMLKNVFIDSIETLVDPERKMNTSRRYGGTASRIGYSNIYDNQRAPVRAQLKELDDLVFSTMGDAEAVLSSLYDRADAYGRVTVGDLYDIVGLTGDYTINSFGWTRPELETASIRPIQYGYVLDLPTARPIRR